MLKKYQEYQNLCNIKKNLEEQFQQDNNQCIAQIRSLACSEMMIWLMQHQPNDKNELMLIPPADRCFPIYQSTRLSEFCLAKRYEEDFDLDDEEKQLIDSFDFQYIPIKIYWRFRNDDWYIDEIKTIIQERSYPLPEMNTSEFINHAMTIRDALQLEERSDNFLKMASIHGLQIHHECIRLNMWCDFTIDCGSYNSNTINKFLGK